MTLVTSMLELSGVFLGWSRGVSLLVCVYIYILFQRDTPISKVTRIDESGATRIDESKKTH